MLVNGSQDLLGKTFTVKIVKAEKWCIHGEVITPSHPSLVHSLTQRIHTHTPPPSTHIFHTSSTHTQIIQESLLSCPRLPSPPKQIPNLRKKKQINNNNDHTHNDNAKGKENEKENEKENVNESENGKVNVREEGGVGGGSLFWFLLILVVVLGVVLGVVW